MQETASANGETDWRTIERPVMPGRLHLSVGVNTRDLSAPRVNWVLGKAELVERKFVNEIEEVVGDDVDVWRRNQSGEFLPQMSCPLVECQVVADASDVPEEDVQALVETALELEGEFVEVAGEAQTAAQSGH